jgi:hypothetical protein
MMGRSSIRMRWPAVCVPPPPNAFLDLLRRTPQLPRASDRCDVLLAGLIVGTGSGLAMGPPG